MFLADTLSRAYLPEVHACKLSKSLEDINQSLSLECSAECLQRFKHVSADDLVLQEFHKIVQQGWPDSKSEVPEIVQAYY